MTRPPQILAISNSSALFSEVWEEPVLARFVMKLVEKRKPVIYHVGAANGDSTEKTAKFFSLARRVGFEGRHLNLFALEDDDPASFFRDADAIYVDGGSTRNLKALMQEWRADEALINAYEQGVLIIGASAGANILFQWGTTDSVRTRISVMQGWGLIDGSVSVHANVRADRRTAFERHLASGQAVFPAYTLDDDTALLFRNGHVSQAVTVTAKSRIQQILGPDQAASLLECRDLTESRNLAR